ncbi:hypothetical protein [Paenibacillus ehimensis]|uniref:Uncharacterized protein n=1 Tax=Paenibacillus ehimensis TaxID=79264 RepID=A0ABT8VM82_9BACL|nr:hypothetical protein [Paenibacillus ehimensis]MDO3682095.1 hypothetical protein [Paenibacillus ehimensis]
MENAKVPMANVITQEFLFKGEMSGTSKKSGNPYRSIELHDPNSLENMSFFLDPGNSVNTTGIQFRDKVFAEFAMEFRFGKLQPILKNLKKA